MAVGSVPVLRRRRRSSGRVWILRAVIGLVVLASGPLVSASPAGVVPAGDFSPVDEASFVTALNEQRAAVGLPAMVVEPEMTAAARLWTQWMADNRTLQHAGDIVTGAPSTWRKVGENVGRGPSLVGLMDAFMASPGHRANILDPVYTHVGVGAIRTAEGTMYTTHRFAHVPGSQPPSPADEPVPPSLGFDTARTSPPVDAERLQLTLDLLVAA